MHAGIWEGKSGFIWQRGGEASRKARGSGSSVYVSGFGGDAYSQGSGLSVIGTCSAPCGCRVTIAHEGGEADRCYLHVEQRASHDSEPLTSCMAEVQETELHNAHE